uniref:Dynactin subunit 4 n=1 Tax=Elaeophora elaphi TaxID=1147741 RepID=A0A0R3RF98_9BILA
MRARGRNDSMKFETDAIVFKDTELQRWGNMAALFSIDHVRYECSCGEWESLNRLYFCRHCSNIRCMFCVSQEMDTSFCPSCLDNVPTAEARQKRNRCSNCYQCPICGVSAVIRASGETYHLSCNTCRWTTADSGIPDSTSSTIWPQYQLEDEQLLYEFLERMKNYAAIERADRERHKYSKRRSNLGTVLSDRFGLQTMYNRRKAALAERTEKEFSVLEPTDDVPPLDDSIFDEQELDVGSLATLMQQVKQPLANARALLPIKTPLAGRHSIRCKQCDHSLCKGEYSPTSIKFKIQVLAGNHVPDIRLSRQAALVASQWCPLFLTVSNFSASLARVVIIPYTNEDESYVKCDSPVIELSVPNRDDAMEWDETFEKSTNETEGRRHRIGIRFNVYATEGDDRKLALIVKYSNCSSSFEHGGDQTWLQHKVCVFLEITATMETKTGDEKFGHALHDDLTLSAICKKIKQKESEGNRRVRLSRRAWKYRIDDDESEKEAYMQRCAYVSRRTQLACKNYRQPSELTLEGFCEVHTHFFQQLAQYALAEQRCIERTLFSKPKDISTIADDETLMMVENWACAEQDSFNDVLLDDDDEDPLKNAEVWTDEEVIRCQLSALERKLSVTRDLRKLIAEKVRRLTVSYSKAMEEDQKKGKAKVEDSRLREIQLANRKYHSYHSAKNQYMLRRLKARLEWDGSEEHKLDYLKIDDMKNAQCIFIPKKSILSNGESCKTVIESTFKISEEPDETSAECDSDIIQSILNNLCEQIEQALDSGKDLMHVSLKDGNEGRKKEHRCSNSTLPKLNYCVTHVYDDHRQHLFAPCTECGALGLDFGDGLKFCFKHIAKKNSINTVERWETITVQQGVVPMSTSDIRSTLGVRQVQSDVRPDLKSLADPIATAVNSGGNVDEGSKNLPVKFIVIDEKRDEKNGADVKINTPSKGTVRNSGDMLLQHGMSMHRSWQEEDLYSCARTRPFTTENFPKTKIRQTAGTRYSLSDVRDYLGGSMLSPSIYRSQEQLSKSMVQELLSGGPSRAAASASQFSRRIAAPTTTFTPKIGFRRTVCNTVVNRSAIEPPEMISLGSTTSASVAPTSVNSTPVLSRPVMQRPIVLRGRTDTSSFASGQPVRLPSRYIATVGTSRPLPNWRNRSTISLDSRIRRAPANVVLPMDYSNRPANAAASRIGPYFRRRDERQFISGNARSRLVAIDSLSYTAPRVQPRSSYPLPTFRQDIPKPVVCRPRITTEPRSQSTAETLETAAAVASIAADLEAREDKEDEPDEVIGRLETSAWQTAEESPISQKLAPEQSAATGPVSKKKGEIISCASGTSSKRSVSLLSRQSSGESTEDGLAVLAMAAASRAFDSDQSSPPIKKSKYGQLGLEEEDDE